MLDRPIALRHPFIFYLGHLPAFFDIQLSRALNEPLTSPQQFASIFERGMDPIVSNPRLCHSHSPAPAKWPAANDILEYREKVIDRMERIIAGDKPIDRRTRRILNMCYEHEAMHIETLIYMFVQNQTRRIPNIPMPLLSTENVAVPASWIQIGGGKVRLGLDDCESWDIKEDRELDFGWDNESPTIWKNVEEFEIHNRPVTVSEYFTFLKAIAFPKDLVPSSWIQNDETWHVKTVYGPVEFKYCVNWPVYCCHYQAERYASYFNCRLPTEEEIVLIRHRNKSPSSNFSYKVLLPVSVKVGNSTDVTDIVGNGWELTSTIFQEFEGYSKSELYPGYSADFL